MAATEQRGEDVAPRNFDPEFISPVDPALLQPEPPDGADPSPALEPHPILLQSSDDVFFAYDLALLSEYSSFFAGLADLPVPSSSDSQVIPLHPIPPPALRYVLRATTARRARTPPPAFPSLETARDVITVADEFDMPFLYGTLHGTQPDLGPFVRYALASLAGDRVAELARPLRGYTVGEIDPWAAGVLCTAAPEAYARLVRFLERWLRDMNSFKRFFIDTAFEVRERTDAEAEMCPTQCALARQMRGNLEGLSKTFVDEFITDVGRDLPTYLTMHCKEYVRKLYPHCSACAEVWGDLVGYIWKRFSRQTGWEL